MIITWWAFVVVMGGWNAPMVQVGPFLTLDHCQEAKRIVESIMSVPTPSMGTITKTSECFKVVAK
jgi:hypothetical protein